MKIQLHDKPDSDRSSLAFTLIEILVAVVIVSVVFSSLYLAISSGFGVIQATREDLRATQILQEKMETIRLYSWDQVISNGFIPTNFTAPFYATNISSSSNLNNSSSELVYTGTVVVGSVPFSDASYSNSMRLVSVTLNWRSGTSTRLHTRAISTFISQYGLQSYIY